jgi:hypothetical protein
LGRSRRTEQQGGKIERDRKRDHSTDAMLQGLVMLVWRTAEVQWKRERVDVLACQDCGRSRDVSHCVWKTLKEFCNCLKKKLFFLVKNAGMSPSALGRRGKKFLKKTYFFY